MPTRLDNARTIRAPRGPQLSAKSWLTEAPLRMLMNNLDPEVAEKPHELVVYGGIGRAARDWESFDRIVAALRGSRPTRRCCVQSGKPVGVFRTHADAPRVLIANSNLVPHWATLEHFNELDRKGLMMYGQMTAGSWIYIGSQGIVQGTYETFAELGRRHYGGSLAASGSSPPASAAWAGRSRSPPPWRAPRCWRSSASPRASRCGCKTGYLDAQAKDLDEALAMIERACREGEAALGGRARQRRRDAPRAGAARRQARRGDRPDLGARSDQRLPAGRLDARRVGGAARARPRRAVERAAKRRWRRRCARCSSSGGAACRPSTTATTSARWRRRWASRTRSTSPASCRPISARCSAAASARSAGRRCRATRRTSSAPTPR